MSYQTPALSDYWDASDLAPTPYDAALQHAYRGGFAAVRGTPQTGWAHHSTEQGVDIAVHSTEGSSLQTCRGVGTIAADAPVICSVFADIEHRYRWDAMIEKGEVVEQVDRLTRVIHSCFNAPWPVKKRDTVSVGRVQRMPDGSLFSYATSVEHARCPPQKDYIRASLDYYALYVTPLAASKCRVTYSTSSNPRGSIPNALINRAEVSQPLNIVSVNKLIRNQSQLVAQVRQRLDELYQRHDKTDGAAVTAEHNSIGHDRKASNNANGCEPKEAARQSTIRGTGVIEGDRDREVI